MNILQARTEYLEWKATYTTRASVAYRRWLDIFISVCGKKDLARYGIHDLVKYKNWLEDNSYSPTTTQFAMIVLHNFFKFYKLRGKKCLAPELIRIRRMIPNSHRAITEEEFIKILEVIDNDFIGLRNKLVISMLWDTGVRVSELCDLNVEQLSREYPKTVIQTKKNGKNRIIIWSQETHNLLYQYLPMRAVLTSISPLFIGNATRGITRLSARSIERIFKYYAKKAGIVDKVTPHSCRHGWAHHRRDKYNAPLAFIQRGLGHSNPVSTFIYEQYSDKEFEKQAQGYL